MLNRRHLLALSMSAAITGLLLAAAPVRAETSTPFSAEAFEAARTTGKPILIEISAPWCPTCKAQKPILSQLKSEAGFADLVILEVDFDSQKDVVRGFGAQMQSTLIALRGDKETGRSVGETDPAAIRALLLSAVEG